jgi:hypothetical protein
MAKMTALSIFRQPFKVKMRIGTSGLFADRADLP